MGDMDIALVTETFPPEVNGVAMTLGRMADGLCRRGHRLRVVRPRQQPNEQPATTAAFSETLVRGLPIPRYPGLRFGLPATARLLREWQASPPDIVHVATEGPLGRSAIKAAATLDIPVSSSYHTNFHAYSHHYGVGLLHGLIERYLRHFHNRTQATLVPTHGLAQSLAETGYRNLVVVSRGVDTSLFSPARRSAALRQQWGAAARTLVATYVGRIAPEKNLDLAIVAFEAIRRSHPDAKLVFVGDGPQKSALATRHPEYIFCGVKLAEDLAAHYASADLFLFPSLTETFGNVTVEALASGLGVVAFDCAAAGELIEHGSNGLLAAPGDEAAFIDAAVTLALQPGLLPRVRLRAAARVARHDWEFVHDAIERTLEDIMLLHARRQMSLPGTRPTTAEAAIRP